MLRSDTGKDREWGLLGSITLELSGGPAGCSARAQRCVWLEAVCRVGTCACFLKSAKELGRLVQNIHKNKTKRTEKAGREEKTGAPL